MEDSKKTLFRRTLKNKFTNKFCYQAGDGTRVSNSPEQTQKVFDWFFSILIEKEEKIEDLEDQIEALELGNS